jgi:hypothetical protein
MKNRPLVLVLLSLIHFSEPLLKIFYFKAKTHFELTTILSNVMTFNAENIVGFIDFWLVFPLGGLALLSIKRWSFPLFIAVQLYSVTGFLTYQKFSWPYFAETPFYSSFLLLIMNSLLIVYVSLPEVRQLFFNQSMRWWETRARYTLRLPLTLWHTNPSKLEKACLTNISDSGAFILTNKKVDLGEYIHINISFLDHHVTVKGLVVRSQYFDGNQGVGVRFIYTTPFSIIKFKTRSLVRTIKKHQLQSNALVRNLI